MDVSTHTDRSYNYEDVSLFFIKSYNLEQIGPLINTKWHQRYPFNIDAPNGYAGCIPVAVAQITYYYRYPAKYNWNLIYPNPILNDAFKYFITDVRNLCKVKYESDGTGSNYEKAWKAFQSSGYNVTKAGLPDLIKLRNEMKTKSPVYIQRENSQTGKGHAWVCEGYQNVRYEGVHIMVRIAKGLNVVRGGFDGEPAVDDAVPHVRRLLYVFHICGSHIIFRLNPDDARMQAMRINAIAVHE